MSQKLEKRIPFDSEVAQVFGRRSRAGDVGIEIEVESNAENALPQMIENTWQVHRDHSLRGDSAEYVTSEPIEFKRVPKVLEYLRRNLPLNHLRFSSRTSVHIHINMTKFLLRHVYSYVTIYTIVEDILTDFAGPARSGNLFCLGMKDAEGIVTEIVKGLRRGDGLYFFRGDGTRYGGLNLNALWKFGSLEIRTMEGNIDVDRITTWVGILAEIREYAASVPDPRRVIEDFSAMGPREFVRQKLPTLYQSIQWKAEYPQYLYESMRLAQDIAYNSDWAEYKLTENTKKKSSADFRAVPARLQGLEAARLLTREYQRMFAGNNPLNGAEFLYNNGRYVCNINDDGVIVWFLTGLYEDGEEPNNDLELGAAPEGWGAVDIPQAPNRRR